MKFTVGFKFMSILSIFHLSSVDAEIANFKAIQNSFDCLETTDIRCARVAGSRVPLELCPYSLDPLRNPLSNPTGYTYAMTNIHLREEWFCYPEEYGNRPDAYIAAHDFSFRTPYDTDKVLNWNEVEGIISNDNTSHQTFVTPKRHGMISHNQNNNKWVITGDAWKEMSSSSDTTFTFTKMYMFTPCHTEAALDGFYEDFASEHGCTTDTCHIDFPANLFTKYQLFNLENISTVTISGISQTGAGSEHLIGVDPNVYKIEKMILQERAKLMRQYWFKEWEFSITQQTCADKAQWNSGKVQTSFVDQNDACGQCLPWKRANQEVVTLWHDKCQYNQGGWHYESPYHSGTANWYGWDSDKNPIQGDYLDDNRKWAGELTDACRKCKAYMECRCEYCDTKFGYRSTFWVDDKYNYVSNGDKYGMHRKPKPSNANEWYHAPYGEGDLGHTTCRSVEYELLPQRERESSSERQRTTLATEVKNWRAIITSIGVNGGLRSSSRRSREALLDILMDSETVLYGQDYADKKKAESKYSKFWTSASELCSGPFETIAPPRDWCQVQRLGGPGTLTPWPFDPTKVMLDYSIINILLELDRKITRAIDTILDEASWEIMDGSVGSWRDVTSNSSDFQGRSDYMGNFIDMVSLDKITERSIWLQTQSKKWSDELSSDERFKNKFFWRTSASDAEDEIRSEVAETIYANSAIHGIKKGDEQIQIEEPNNVQFRKIGISNDIETLNPYGWNPWTKTRDGEGTKGYAEPNADDASLYTFKSVWENRGWWKRETEYEHLDNLQNLNMFGEESDPRRYLDYQYKTLWEALKTRKDPDNRDDTPWKHTYTLSDEPKDSIETIEDKFGESLGLDFDHVFNYSYYEDLPTDIQAEKSVLKKFINPEFVNKLGKNYSIWNVRKALELYEKVTKVSNPYRGTLKYLHARKKASIEQDDLPIYIELFNEFNTPLDLQDSQPHWFSDLAEADENFFVGKHTVPRAEPPISTSLNLNELVVPVLQGSVNEDLRKDTLKQKRTKECIAECEGGLVHIEGEKGHVQSWNEICKGQCIGNPKIVSTDNLVDVFRYMLDFLDFFLLGEQPDSLTQGIQGKTEQVCKFWKEKAEEWAENNNDDDDADYTAWRLKLLKRDDTGLRLSVSHPKFPVGVSGGRGTWTDVGFYFGTNMQSGLGKTNHFCGWANGRGGWWSVGIQWGASVPIALEVLTGKGFGFQLSIAVENFKNIADFDRSDNIANFYHSVEEDMVGLNAQIDSIDVFGKYLSKFLLYTGLMVGNSISADIAVGVSSIRPRTVDIKEWRDNCKQWINLQDNGETAAKDAALYEYDKAARAEKKSIDCAKYDNNDDALTLRRKKIECDRLKTKKCSQGNSARQRVCENSAQHKMLVCEEELEKLEQRTGTTAAELHNCQQHHDVAADKADLNMRNEYGDNYFARGEQWAKDKNIFTEEFGKEVFDNSWRMGAETFVTSFTGTIPETDEIFPSFFDMGERNYKSKEGKGRFCDKQCQQECANDYLCIAKYDGRYCDEDCEKTCRLIDKGMRGYKKHACDVSYLFLAKDDPDGAAEKTAKCHELSSTCSKDFNADGCSNTDEYYLERPVYVSFEFVIGTASADSLMTHALGTATAMGTTAAYKAVSTVGHKVLDEIDGKPKKEQAKREEEQRDFVNYKLSRVTNTVSAKVLSGTLLFPGNPYWSIAESTVVAPIFHAPSDKDPTDYEDYILRQPPSSSMGFNLTTETESVSYTGLPTVTSYVSDKNPVQMPGSLIIFPKLRRDGQLIPFEDREKYPEQQFEDWQIVTGSDFKNSVSATRKDVSIKKETKNKGCAKCKPIKSTVVKKYYALKKFNIPEASNGTVFVFREDMNEFQNVRYYVGPNGKKNLLEDKSMTISRFREDSRTAQGTNSALNLPVRFNNTVVIGHVGVATVYDDSTGIKRDVEFWKKDENGVETKMDIGQLTKVLPILDHNNKLAFAIRDTIYFGTFNPSDNKFTAEPGSFTIPKCEYCSSAFIAPTFGDADGDSYEDIIYLNSESDIRFCKGVSGGERWLCGGGGDIRLIHENHPDFDKQSTYITKDLSLSHCAFVLSTYDGTLSCLERNNLVHVMNAIGNTTTTNITLQAALVMSTNAATEKYTWTLHQDSYEGAYEPIYADEDGDSQTGCGKKCGKTAKRIATSMARHFLHHRLTEEEQRQDQENYEKVKKEHAAEDAARNAIRQELYRNVRESDKRKSTDTRHETRARQDRIARGIGTAADLANERASQEHGRTSIKDVFGDGVRPGDLRGIPLEKLSSSIKSKLSEIATMVGRNGLAAGLEAVKNGGKDLDMSKFDKVVSAKKVAMLVKHRARSQPVANYLGFGQSPTAVFVRVSGQPPVDLAKERFERAENALKQAQAAQSIAKTQAQIDGLKAKKTGEGDEKIIEAALQATIKAEDNEMRRFGRPYLVELDEDGHVKKFDADGGPIPFGDGAYYGKTARRKYIIPDSNMGDPLTQKAILDGQPIVDLEVDSKQLISAQQFKKSTIDERIARATFESTGNSDYQQNLKKNYAPDKVTLAEIDQFGNEKRYNGEGVEVLKFTADVDNGKVVAIKNDAWDSAKGKSSPVTAPKVVTGFNVDGNFMGTIDLPEQFGFVPSARHREVGLTSSDDKAGQLGNFVEQKRIDVKNAVNNILGHEEVLLRLEKDLTALQETLSDQAREGLTPEQIAVGVENAQKEVVAALAQLEAATAAACRL